MFVLVQGSGLCLFMFYLSDLLMDELGWNYLYELIFNLIRFAHSP